MSSEPTSKRGQKRVHNELAVVENWELERSNEFIISLAETDTCSCWCWACVVSRIGRRQEMEKVLENILIPDLLHIPCVYFCNDMFKPEFDRNRINLTHLEYVEHVDVFALDSNLSIDIVQWFTRATGTVAVPNDTEGTDDTEDEE